MSTDQTPIPSEHSPSLSSQHEGIMNTVSKSGPPWWAQLIVLVVVAFLSASGGLFASHALWPPQRGPQGVAGPAGQEGPQGPQGPSGLSSPFSLAGAQCIDTVTITNQVGEYCYLVLPLSVQSSGA